jgi:hypothetical protein
MRREARGVGRTPRQLDAITTRIAEIGQMFRTAGELARTFRRELRSRPRQLTDATKDQVRALLAGLPHPIPGDQIDSLFGRLQDPKVKVADAEKAFTDLVDLSVPEWKGLIELEEKFPGSRAEEEMSELLAQKLAIADEMYPSAEAVYNDVQKKFRDRAAKAGVAIPDWVEFHHLLLKHDFPELALDPRFLVLAPRGDAGIDKLHDLLHDLSAGLSTDAKWSHLVSDIAEMIKETLGS